MKDLAFIPIKSGIADSTEFAGYCRDLGNGTAEMTGYTKDFGKYCLQNPPPITVQTIHGEVDLVRFARVLFHV